MTPFIWPKRRAKTGLRAFKLKIKNLFKQIPADLSEEAFTEILKCKSFRLERIISKGHSTPEGEWYDQQDNEWVLLLSGRAGLLIEGEGIIILEPGDYILLPAGVRHRVEWTDQAGKTVWLALHFSEPL